MERRATGVLDQRGRDEREQLACGRVALRSISQADYDWLYSLETDSRVTHRWRLQGRSVSPDEYLRLLWTNVLVQYVVVERVNDFKVGLVICYAADTSNGTASVALVSDPKYHDTGLAIDGMVLLIDHLFRGWPFRKLYFEALEFNWQHFGDRSETSSIDFKTLWVMEGRLREVMYYDGRYWDKFIGSISRQPWLDHADLAFDRVRRRAGGGIDV